MRSRGSTIFKKTGSANLGAGMKDYDIVSVWIALYMQ